MLSRFSGRCALSCIYTFLLGNNEAPQDNWSLATLTCSCRVIIKEGIGIKVAKKTKWVYSKQWKNSCSHQPKKTKSTWKENETKNYKRKSTLLCSIKRCTWSQLSPAQTHRLWSDQQGLFENTKLHKKLLQIKFHCLNRDRTWFIMSKTL